MSAGQLARHRSSSSSTRPSYRPTTPIDTRISEEVDFEPCAATASIFLYTQGNAILCLHHDTLAIERRFELHKEKVLFIAVDNVSERDQGRLVVSYDASYTAIVWEINSGRQIASFISYEPYRVAAWMKNGKIAFGGSQGSVVLFTPSNTETESARTIFDPITAIAPAWDCQTYAIGYQNGSILLVKLEPIVPKPINGPNLGFTILHTLTTQRAPSPIVSLAWHASSTKQKSDMLASQTMDGDLRIWSVSKPPTAESPKTIRILKRRDNTEPGQHWCAWSKNGRVLQFSDGEAWSWDVRTKHVSCEPVPTVDGVRGIACFGAQATLFTLGPDHTVQQYDTSPPALVKNVRYGLMLPPPNRSTPAQQIPGTAPPVPVSRGSDVDRGAVTLSTIQNTANEMASIDHARQLREEMASPTLSSTSRTDTMSSRSSNHRVYPSRHIPSVSSRAQSGTTFSTVSPSMVGRDSLYSGTTSLYQSTASISSAGRRSKGSRLRQEVLRSPEKEYVDLFPRTKLRLSNIAYQQPQPLDQDNLTPDECRRNMLEVVFGWEDDIEQLIRDELHYHRQGSQSGVLLAKWLGDVDSDMMAAAISSGGASSSDWMVLCLSQMGGSGMGKLGQAFVQRLLQQGEFHTAATILLGLDQREDAVEVYVSRSFYMEAILLTCLVFPTDWQRQAHLVRRWGEFVVENSQQHLAIRCFSCTGVEPPIPWMSPSPGPISTPSQAPSSISSMLSPPVSPPLSAPPMHRMTAKNASLKVITSFEAPAQGKFRFPGLASTDRTPTNGPGVTPIAESAISPGGTPGGFRRNTNNLARGIVTPGGYLRNRLPSIGETPVDVTLPPFPRPSQLPTPDNSGSDLEKEKEKSRQSKAPSEEDRTAVATEAPPLLLTSARYDPGNSRIGSPMTAVPQTTVRTTILPEPSQDSFNALMEKSRARNGSRDRKPDGLHIRMPSQDQIQTTHYISSEGKIRQEAGEHRRKNTLNSLPSAGLSTSGLSTSGLSTGGLSTGRSDYRSDARSPSISGASWASAKSPSISGRSIDQYISSLEEAGYHQKKKHTSSRRHKSREGREHKARSKGRVGDRSEDRGRDERKKIRPAKRSPSSPKPMSPETYIDPMSGEHLDDRIRSPISEGRHLRDTPKNASKIRSGSKASNYSHHTDRTVVRHRSPEGLYDRLGTDSGFRSGKSSRQPSPRGLFDSNGRGRSKSKNEGSQVRSPSSPLPMSPQADYYRGSDEDEDPVRIVEANRQRLRSRHRSRSRRPRERNTSSRRDISTDRRREDQHLRIGDFDEPRSAVEPRRGSGDILLSAAQQPKLHRQISERTQKKKELAARELEARRESLLRNPEAPPILHPDEYSGRPNIPYRSQTDLSNTPTSWDPVVPSHHSQRFPENNGDFISRAGAASVGPYGLPATPRAMRHPRYDNKANDIPAVPEIPESIQPLPETYYTGQPKFELPRSMSAPIPEQQFPQRSEELPSHPAFHKGLRPGKRSNFSPLGDIGSHRRRPSDDTNMMTRSQDTNSIAGVLASADSGVQIVSIEEPPLLPELQHLQQQGIPPPPPPPPAPFAHNRMDTESSSLSSNSNVGVISMVLDNEPGDESNVIEVPPPPPPIVLPVRSPRLHGAGSPPPSMSRSSSNHRRGRSENFKNGFSVKGITDRLRSTSRGRNTKSPEHNTPSPYESVPPLYF